jgi:hypothetical protein
MKKKRPEPRRATPKQWAELGRTVLERWRGAFAPPKWAHEIRAFDLAYDDDLGDGGRSFALAGVHSIFDEALAADIGTACDLLSDVMRRELFSELKKQPHAEALANQVSSDVAEGVLCELCLPSMGISPPWVPTFSRALDAWGAGLALGSGTDEHGAWAVAPLGLAKPATLGPSGITARHAAIAAELQTAAAWVRQLRIETDEGGEKAVDFMDLVRDIASGKRTR